MMARVSHEQKRLLQRGAEICVDPDGIRHCGGAGGRDPAIVDQEVIELSVRTAVLSRMLDPPPVNGTL